MRDGSNQTQQSCVRSGPERQTQGHTAATEGCPRVPPHAPSWPPAPPVSSLSRGPDLSPCLCCFPSRELGLKSPVHTSDSGRHCRISGRLPPLQPPKLGPMKGTGGGGGGGQPESGSLQVARCARGAERAASARPGQRWRVLLGAAPARPERRVRRARARAPARRAGRLVLGPPRAVATGFCRGRGKVPSCACRVPARAGFL